MTFAHHFDLALWPLTLACGHRLDTHHVRGWFDGPSESRFAPGPDLAWLPEDAASGAAASSSLTPGPKRPIDDRPSILLVHALTADAQAGGPGGWWAPLIGPGRALDPTRYRLICFNNLGSCYGSSGSADPEFPIREISAWDQARSLWMALDQLGVGKLELVVGGSLGAMISLALAALAPDRVRRLMPIAASKASSAWVLGFNHVQRQVLELFEGRPHDDRPLQLARQLALLSYRAPAGLEARQGRQVADPPFRYRVESYLEHQGHKLDQRFDRRAYLAMMQAMDSFDLGVAPGTPGAHESWQQPSEPGVLAIHCPTLAVGIDSDQLFPPGEMAQLIAPLKQRGQTAEYAEITSLHGHDAFLIEWEQLEALLQRALRLEAC